MHEYPFEDPYKNYVYSEALPPLGAPDDVYHPGGSTVALSSFQVSPNQITAEKIKGQALRYNTGKSKLSYTPVALMEGASRAMVYGATKYERNNWRKGFPQTEVMDCLLRHAMAWLEGQDCDEESQLHHFDHIAANVAFLLHMQKTGTGTDDRAI